MRITIQGYAPIEIPESLMVKETGAFGAETSYVAKVVSRIQKPSYLNTKLPLKLSCLERLKARMEALGGYKSFYEPLAGIGLSARLFGAKETYLNDLDPGCQSILKGNFYGECTVTGKDAYETPFPLSDLIFLDFNAFTLKRCLGKSSEYNAPVTRAFSSSRKFVVLNDCSNFYFRYGKSSYAVYSKLLGIPINSFEEYFRAARVIWQHKYPEWQMVHVAAFKDSSFQLFYRGEAYFEYDLIEKPSTYVSVGGVLLS